MIDLHSPSRFAAFELAMDTLQHAQERWREALACGGVDEELRDVLKAMEDDHTVQRAQLRAIYDLGAEFEEAP